jgi:F0F1-type ATP synthase membrane subunit c/vacuolar-type H+-ATPase subunit K
MAVLTKGAKGVVGVKAAKGAAKNPGILTKGAKGFAGVKAVKGVANNPNVVKLGAKASKPVAKRKARKGVKRVERFGEAAAEFGRELVVYGPQAAQELGLIEQPKPKRTAPRVAAGVVIGATAVYFLEPETGREHREKVMKLVA